MYRVDITADLNDEDHTGYLWTFLDEARDALLAEQDPQALVADVAGPPPQPPRNSASLARLQAENGRSCPAGLDLAIFLISRRSPG
jgi:hypothetical protein